MELMNDADLLPLSLRDNRVYKVKQWLYLLELEGGHKERLKHLGWLILGGRAISIPGHLATFATMTNSIEEWHLQPSFRPFRCIRKLFFFNISSG